MFGIFTLLLFPFFLVVGILSIPFMILQDKMNEKKARQFLERHDDTYFFIYSSGRRKVKYYESLIIPKLNPGIEVIKYDGEKYNCFFEPVSVHSIMNLSEKGYPIIGKMEEGKVITKSLKDEFIELVLKQKEVHQFNDLLQRKIDKL